MSTRSGREDDTFDTRSIDDPRLWILAAAFEGKFAPLPYTPHLSWVRQIASAVRRAPLLEQERWRTGCEHALSQWAPEYGGAVLRDVSFLALEIRATAVVRHLRMLLGSPLLSADEYGQLRGDLVWVLVSFAPLSEAAEALSRYFWDDSFDMRCAALLFIGSAVCAPDDYPKLVKRFFQVRERDRKFFDDTRWTILESVRVIGLAVLNRHLDFLSVAEIDEIGCALLSSGFSFESDTTGGTTGRFCPRDEGSTIESVVTADMPLSSVLMEVREFEFGGGAQLVFREINQMVYGAESIAAHGVGE